MTRGVEFVKILYVKPVVTEDKLLKKLKKKTCEVSGVALTYYPYWIFYFKAELWRLLMKPRVVRLVVSVDGVTGKPAQGGPEVDKEGKLKHVEGEEVEGQMLVKLEVCEEEALRQAESFAKRYMAYLFPGKNIKLEVERRELIYRPFWLVKMRDVIKALDAIDGEEITISTSSAIKGRREEGSELH
ncbi:MAG: hypothetical protein DRJ62_04630 [Thermoprotei archaeon]|nr:MAG: hypothetical protein DRJ62_04630 [Thermoprotei archaeon]